MRVRTARFKKLRLRKTGKPKTVDIGHRGDKVMAQVLATVPIAGLEAVLVAVELVIESGALSAEHVENVLARLNASPVPEGVETALQLKEVPLANTSRYDSLREIDEVTVSAVEANHA